MRGPARGLILLACALALSQPSPVAAKAAPRYAVDRAWPKTFPDHWVFGAIGGVCVDGHDHVFILHRQDPPESDFNAGHLAPPIVEVDAAGKLINAWGDPKLLDPRLHSCAFDRQGNIWIASAPSGMVQKYSHDGKLLLQVGRKGVYDTADGTEKGRPLNSDAAVFTDPSSLWIDPANGNYRLKTNPVSPAINSGTGQIFGGEPGTDIEGHPRIVGSAPDRGAYESSFSDFAVLTVTNTHDSGAGSLRQAMLDANSSPTIAKQIKFDIRDANLQPICPAVIALSSALPTVGSSSPVMSLKIDDLPAPLRPMIPQRSPSATVKVMFLKSSVAPKETPMLESERRVTPRWEDDEVLARSADGTCES